MGCLFGPGPVGLSHAGISLALMLQAWAGPESPHPGAGMESVPPTPGGAVTHMNAARE